MKPEASSSVRHLLARHVQEIGWPRFSESFSDLLSWLEERPQICVVDTLDNIHNVGLSFRPFSQEGTSWFQVLDRSIFPSLLKGVQSIADSLCSFPQQFVLSEPVHTPAAFLDAMKQNGTCRKRIADHDLLLQKCSFQSSSSRSWPVAQRHLIPWPSSCQPSSDPP